ncbi:MAG: ABC transporter permease [Deltaproteobacteria bacterium]|nr:ABC transporter permease [Deltaproteobacteria bacterium]
MISRLLTFWLPLAWLLFVTLCAVTAGWMPMPAPDIMDYDHQNASPGTEVTLPETPAGEVSGARSRVYWLGTDSMGRDMLSRVIIGARVSLTVGGAAPLIGLAIGGLLGMVAGYFRGVTESIIIGFMDVILAFPGLVLLLGVGFYFGTNLWTLIPSLGFLSVPAFCRVSRAATLQLAGREFVIAAKMIGNSNSAILVREILPNVAIPLCVYGLIIMALMIVVEGVLSFLGLSVPPPTPSWGGMIAAGREVLSEAPHVCLIPAAVLFLTVLSLNVLGDTLRGWTRPL